jgi:hypothetical protein
MNVRVGVCFLFLMCASGAVGQQQPELQHRDPQEKHEVTPPPPPAMKAAEKLEPARAANANGLYRALRTRTANGPAFTVKNLSLKRDAGVFTFNDGTFYLYGEVGGMVTGAVFLGSGTLYVEPPSPMERRQLKIVMKTEVLNQPFTSAVFEFTDGTAEELRRGAVANATVSGSAVVRAQDTQGLFRKSLKHDLEARLLEDIVRPGGGGFFLADMKGPMFSKRLIYVVDPHGAIGVEPEEVGLLTSSDESYDVTLGFRSEEQRRAKQTMVNDTFRIPQQTIDVTIEKNGKVTATVVSAVTAVANGVQVVPLMLAPTLRVSGVWGPGGEALDYIQEDKDHDADFAVVLQKPLKAGETIQITTSYAGKDVVLDMGNGNYYLVARESWYPNVRGSFGNYAYYYMTFHTLKYVQVVATGDRVTEKEQGQQKISEWQTLTPIAVAGFNLGEFKSDQSERNKNVQVVTYANTQLADHYSGLSDRPGMALGTLSTTGMLKVATSEGDAAIQIYTDFFGPLPYDHVSLTQQTACDYGQSWPTLVYLPICYFWDDTVQHQLGLLDSDPSYWKVVTAHEVAHQWWGQTVGFASYRDQWMSEGFADFSASLFLMETRKDQKEYRDFWALLRRRLLEKNAQGVRPVDVGPVVMGSRVNTSRSGGDVYQLLIYPKGAYILHMLEMLFWSSKYGEAPFKAAMHDFAKSYRNKAATTEDFKAVMERDMPSWIDVDKNHKLDWFFNAYVYGTEVPKYTMTSTFEKKGEETTAHFTLTQSGVSDDFTMLVPLYVEYADKRVVLLGRVTLKGSHSIEQSVNLGKLSNEPKRMVANYNFDLLSD